MQRNLVQLLGIALLVLAGCTTSGVTGSGGTRSGGTRPDVPLTGGQWETIRDLQQIATLRQQVNKPGMSIDKVVVLRFTNEAGKRVELASLAPAVIGTHQGGARTARTVFNFSPDREHVVLFTQDVPHWLAYRMELPVAQLKPGDVFRFPVVQTSGEVLVKPFTIEQVIVR